jgi:hypothetical protein
MKKSYNPDVSQLPLRAAVGDRRYIEPSSNSIALDTIGLQHVPLLQTPVTGSGESSDSSLPLFSSSKEGASQE